MIVLPYWFLQMLKAEGKDELAEEANEALRALLGAADDDDVARVLRSFWSTTPACAAMQGREAGGAQRWGGRRPGSAVPGSAS